MKKFILSILIILFAISHSWAKQATLKLDIKLQNANSKIETHKLQLKRDEVLKYVTKNQNGKKLLVEIKNIDQDNNMVQIKIKNKNKLIGQEMVQLEKDKETLLQSFDSQGNNEYKLLLKANKRSF